jgi:hypothetical protein
MTTDEFYALRNWQVLKNILTLLDDMTIDEMAMPQMTRIREQVDALQDAYGFRFKIGD